MNKHMTQGINALASVVENEKNGWFGGHIGAALIAGSELLNSKTLSESGKAALHKRLDQISDQYKNEILTFEHILDQYTDDFSPILNALEISTTNLSHSGHGTIYGALFLTAAQGNKVTMKQVENVASLIINCQQDRGNRYAGIDDYRNHPLTDSTLAIEQQNALEGEWIYQYAVNQSTQDIHYDNNDHFLAGEKVHGITHAQALYQLEVLGYSMLAEQGKQVLLRQLILNNQKPDNKLIKVKAKNFDLTSSNLTVKDFNDLHQIKLAYSYQQLESKLSLPLNKLDNLWGSHYK
ncbi:hypothetical protein L0B53_01505 [Vibrio sp. SS-MA-C1-2]|uniref:hypothetical protein n=1 Tax=Vibrio sp. SS-MA-C1-2 TaxID=2908646 RepID=UPI001F32E0C9|nr:hypothetical protein [Vibrio sp. SS-MA-C1-2]UJF17472.1 hypothetical protein L0B53_01505 [Vibrio sp. SS-MA-C1-2]